MKCELCQTETERLYYGVPFCFSDKCKNDDKLYQLVCEQLENVNLSFKTEDSILLGWR